jgi:hypothetical protein
MQTKMKTKSWTVAAGNEFLANVTKRASATRKIPCGRHMSEETLSNHQSRRAQKTSVGQGNLESRNRAVLGMLENEAQAQEPGA